MNYSETLDWLFSQLPMYQRIGQSAYKADLKATIDLIAHLNHPEKHFKSVHIAGTNGKGSTSHMLASIFQESGYKTGLYTSPHLKDFRERIKINGKMIPQQTVVDFVEKHKPFFEDHQLSFFEMTVGLAFDYFKEEKVDIAIVETGMGGRLDSTNIILPELSVITNIGFDHTQFLGNTLQSIAREKAGIIKTGIPIVVGETTLETKGVFEDVAKEKDAPLYFANTLDDAFTSKYLLDLKGDYQQANLKTVLTSIPILRNKGYQISEEAVQKGLSKVVENTGLQGRWQLLQEKPKVICDTGHNKEGLTWVLSQLKKENYIRLHIVLGVVSDKDLVSILPLFPKDAVYYFCKPDVPRGMEARVLADKAGEFGLVGESFPSVQSAYKQALSNALESDLIFVGGSTFVVGEVL